MPRKRKYPVIIKQQQQQQYYQQQTNMMNDSLLDTKIEDLASGPIRYYSNLLHRQLFYRRFF
jgi:hypothetical protein